jgi:hypothetical protein
MAHKKDSASLLRDVIHLAKAFALEFRIAHRKDFIYNKDFRLEMCCDRERES